MRTAIVEHPIDAAALLAEVSRNRNGAAVLFAGTVREVNDGRAVTGIEYRAYRAMAERELTDIVAETARRFATEDIVAEHRLGALALGDASVVVVAAHPHRGPAFDAARHVIEELKKRVPIWKLEMYADGSREWVEAHSGGGGREAGGDSAAGGRREAGGDPAGSGEREAGGDPAGSGERDAGRVDTAALEGTHGVHRNA